MLSVSQKNLCWRIAMGEEKEDELDRPLTDEEKEEVQDDIEYIEDCKKKGLTNLLKAIDFDE